MAAKLFLIGLWWVLVAFFGGVLMLMNGWVLTGTAMLAFEAGVLAMGYVVCRADAQKVAP